MFPAMDAVPSKQDLYGEVLAAPLVQIFSIWIQTNFGDGRPCEINGSIRVTEGPSTNFLYHREPDESETIQGLGKLSLIGPVSGAILGFTGVTMDLCLKDRSRGIVLIEKQHYLDFATDRIEDTYDKLGMVAVQTENNFAYLYYMAFQFAISAIVEVTIIKKANDAESCFADVHGSLVASYSDNRRYCSSDDELKYLKTILFQASSDKPVRAVVGTPIILPTSVVAVPAYSSLVIEVDLSDSGVQLASGPVEFPASFLDEQTELIQSEKGSVQVKVTWRNAYRYMYKERESKSCNTVADGDKDSESGAKGPSKKGRVLDLGLYGHYLSSSFNVTGDVAHTQAAPALKMWAGYVVEILSLYIGSISCDISALCGKVKVYEDCLPVCIYDRDPDDYDVLPDDKIACIEQHFALENPQLIITTHLRDPVANLEVSTGEIDWDFGRLEHSYAMSWYNKRICSIVRGADGYAALHYIVFDYAIMATVEVAFCCGNFTDIFSVYGILSACYGGHEYSTDYEKKYYRSRLFSRPRNKPVQLTTGSRVPLSKSVVAVPAESFLIIEADLKAMGLGKSDEEAVYGDAPFVIDLSCTTRKEIRVGFCSIEVSVKFEDKQKFQRIFS